MADKTKIGWTDATWGPTRGCSRVSPGCRECYAERIAARFSGPAEILPDGEVIKEAGPFHLFAERTPKPHWTGKVELIESALTIPLRWKKPRRVFVNSMSDLWHEKLRAEDQADVYAVMALAYWHEFQVLTKRPENRLDQFSNSAFKREVEERARYRVAQSGVASWRFTWPLENVWEGVSVENQQYADERIPLLLQTPAAVRFISYEPALGPVDFSPWLDGVEDHGIDLQRPGSAAGCCVGWTPPLDWVIVGGESGPGARSFDIQWARNIVRQCKAAGVKCFVKQMGARVVSSDHTDWVGHYGCVLPTGNGLEERWHITLKDSHGSDPSEWPEDLRVQEFPL